MVMLVRAQRSDLDQTIPSLYTSSYRNKHWPFPIVHSYPVGGLENVSSTDMERVSAGVVGNSICQSHWIGRAPNIASQLSAAESSSEVREELDITYGGGGGYPSISVLVHLDDTSSRKPMI